MERYLIKQPSSKKRKLAESKDSDAESSSSSLTTKSKSSSSSSSSSHHSSKPRKHCEELVKLKPRKKRSKGFRPPRLVGPSVSSNQTSQQLTNSNNSSSNESDESSSHSSRLMNDPNDRYLKVLRKRFGLHSFRTVQRRAIEAIVEHRRDVLLLMPTGGGKSLCFQLPPLIDQKLTIVISPLIALMKNHVDSLQRLGISAVLLNSSVSQSEKNFVYRSLRSMIPERLRRRKSKYSSSSNEPDLNGYSPIELIYTTPETLTASELLNDLLTQLYKSDQLSCFAVDECHCVSSWGHDFRPKYRKLSLFKRLWPKVPVIAVTATATQIVRDDVIDQLCLKNPKIITGSFDRPNLFFGMKYISMLGTGLESSSEVSKKKPSMTFQSAAEILACSDHSTHESNSNSNSSSKSVASQMKEEEKYDDSMMMSDERKEAITLAKSIRSQCMRTTQRIKRGLTESNCTSGQLRLVPTTYVSPEMERKSHARLDLAHVPSLDSKKKKSQKKNKKDLDCSEEDRKIAEDIKEFIVKKYPLSTGLIYCFRQKDTVAMVSLLEDEVSIAEYHAGMTTNQRKSIQDAWESGRIKVIAATTAFGMGIDKSDVRFIIHRTVPKSIEDYYQETGRAGRDGKPSELLSYFSPKQCKNYAYLAKENEIKDVQKKNPGLHRREAMALAEESPRLKNALEKLEKLSEMFMEPRCRRRKILNHFGDQRESVLFKTSQCCEYCRNPEDMKENIEFVKALMNHHTRGGRSSSGMIGTVKSAGNFRGKRVSQKDLRRGVGFKRAIEMHTATEQDQLSMLKEREYSMVTRKMTAGLRRQLDATDNLSMAKAMSVLSEMERRDNAKQNKEKKQREMEEKKRVDEIKEMAKNKNNNHSKKNESGELKLRDVMFTIQVSGLDVRRRQGALIYLHRKIHDYSTNVQSKLNLSEECLNRMAECLEEKVMKDPSSQSKSEYLANMRRHYGDLDTATKGNNAQLPLFEQMLQSYHQSEMTRRRSQSHIVVDFSDDSDSDSDYEDDEPLIPRRSGTSGVLSH